MSDTTETTTSSNQLIDGSVIGIVALLGFAVLLYFLYQRFWRSELHDTPSSGRWVAWLRTMVDLAIGLLVVSAVGVCLGLLISPEGLSVGGEPMNIGDRGISMRFSNDSAGSEQIGQPVPAAELKVRSENAGRGFDADDAKLGETRAQYGANARLYSSQDIEIVETNPTTAAWAAAILTLLLGLGSILTALYALRALLASAGEGNPFDPRTVFWLRVMAGAVAAKVVVAAVGEWIVGRALTSAGGGTDHVPFSMDVGWLGAVFVLLALAEVWRYGVTLQRDAEATV